jgi:cell wall-associated NlpC family hydrolase
VGLLRADHDGLAAGRRVLPHGAKAQLAVGPRISTTDLRPGDLVYYYSPISHNGIYIGNGQIVHATHPGDVVSVDPLNSMPQRSVSIRVIVPAKLTHRGPSSG